MGLYWPNFSLVFVIHLFLYAGVYCNLTSSPLPREKNAAPIFFVIMTGSNAVLNFFLKFLCQIATVVGENNVSSVAVNKYEFTNIG